METHDWILRTLQELANTAKDQRMDRAASRLKFVAEVYAAEASTDEVERVKVLNQLMAEIDRIVA